MAENTLCNNLVGYSDAERSFFFTLFFNVYFSKPGI